MDSQRIWELVKHNIATFVLAIVFFACTVALHYARNWMIAAGLPPWMTEGAELVEVVLFITDGIVILIICITVIKELLLELFRR